MPTARRIVKDLHLANWMGDDAFMRTLHLQIRGLNALGDTLWFRGKVSGKRETEGLYLVDCEFWSDNRRGEQPAMS